MFPGTIFFFFLKRFQTEGPSLLEYTERATKADTGLMNVDQHGTRKVTLYHWETSWGPLASPILNLVQSCSSTEQLKDLMPVMENHTALDDRIALED